MQTDICTVMVTAGWIFLAMRNVSDKRCTKKTHIVFSNFFFSKFLRFIR